MLSKLGVITHSTKLAGSSSGALITASHCAGVPTDHVYKAAVDMAHSCRSHMSCSGTLDKELRKVLESTLPPGGYSSSVLLLWLLASLSSVLHLLAELAAYTMC